MNEKIFNTRIVHKHDTHANWSKTNNFIPKMGELIIYDPDDTHSNPRIKIGDGASQVEQLAFVSDEEFYAQSKEPTGAVNGDFWIDTSVDSVTQKKFYAQSAEPEESNDGDFWIDTSDLA